MSEEGENGVIQFPRERERSSEEIREEINLRELKIKEVQREIESLAVKKAKMEQEIVFLKEELEKK